MSASGDVNGRSRKRVQGDLGEVTIATPRDRDGTFEPQIIGKHQRRVPGFDEKILALYAKGMTTRDIQEIVQDLYGVEVSPTLISTITDDLDAEVTAWRTRPLESVWPIVYFDGIVVHVRGANGHHGRAAGYCGRLRSTHRRIHLKNMTITLDIGGEGRHHGAWNLNPRRLKTKGVGRGTPIPRLILGRAEAIPLPGESVDRVIVERTPLRRKSLQEIRRVITATGTIILRHTVPPHIDPHRLAIQVLSGRRQQRTVHIDGQWLQKTIFVNDGVCTAMARH